MSNSIRRLRLVCSARIGQLSAPSASRAKDSRGTYDEILVEQVFLDGCCTLSLRRLSTLFLLALLELGLKGRRRGWAGVREGAGSNRP